MLRTDPRCDHELLFQSLIFSTKPLVLWSAWDVDLACSAQ